MATVATLEKLSRASNPKTALIMGVGDLSNVHLMSNRVLVAIYIAPEKTAGGIIRATQTIKEDVFQGTVGLVLKKGKTAFRDEPQTHNYFHDQDIEIGDWVVFRPGDAKRIQINGIDCRMVEDTLIDMVISDPELITHK
jgi:co-chaperonin GroES (HSP10)